jgi:hypothetical protein
MIKKQISKEPKLRRIKDEVWLEIAGSGGLYSVSNYGRIKSFTRDKVKGRIMKFADVKGFYTINLKLNGKQKTYLVHKIIASAFLEKKSPDYTYVIHKDWNIKNNHIDNLEWVTRDANYTRVMGHLNEINKNNPNKKVPFSKLKTDDVKLIKTMLSRGVKQNLIAKMFCVSEMQITRIKRGDNWAEVKNSD